MSVDRAELERVLRLLAEQGMLAAEHLIPSRPKLSAPPTPRPPDETPWEEQVAEADEAARLRIARHPTCSVCDRPMTCGQDNHHHMCVR